MGRHRPGNPWKPIKVRKSTYDALLSFAEANGGMTIGEAIGLLLVRVGRDDAAHDHHNDGRDRHEKKDRPTDRPKD